MIKISYLYTKYSFNNQMTGKFLPHNNQLGNIRLSYTWDDEHHQVKTLEENHYYPFGLQHHTYAQPPKIATLKQNNTIEIKQMPPEDVVYKYKYQEQERQDELNLNWDSFKYRNYDYALGRFMSIDPLAEKYPYNSTYAFQENKMGLGRELEGLELQYRDDMGGIHEGPFNMDNVPDDWQEVKTNSEGWSEKLDAVVITGSLHKNNTIYTSTKETTPEQDLVKSLAGAAIITQYDGPEPGPADVVGAVDALVALFTYVFVKTLVHDDLGTPTPGYAPLTPTISPVTPPVYNDNFAKKRKKGNNVDVGESGGEEHTSNARPSIKGKHEKGSARKDRDSGGEDGDFRRLPPRKRPKEWRGPWPPK